MLDLEVGINSYLTIEEADSIVYNEYFEDDAEYKLWESLSENDKAKVIIKGTREIDELLFIGHKIKSWGLSWPRWLYGREVECPEDVKIACIKQILKEKTYGTTKEQQLQDLGVSTYKVKDASISFSTSGNNSGNKINGIYSDIYNTYLNKWTY